MVGLVLGILERDLRFPARLVSWVLVWGFASQVPRVFQEHFGVSQPVSCHGFLFWVSPIGFLGSFNSVLGFCCSFRVLVSD